MEHNPFEPLSERSSPRYHFANEETQYRLKVQHFSKVPKEFTIQRISFEKDVDRYVRAYHSGQNSCFTARGGPRVKSDEPRSPESLERSQRRSKTTLRKLVTELAPDHFVTFTTRETGPEYFTADHWASMWAHFVRLVRQSGAEFEYVAVLERHPSNPEHLHLHVAWRGHCHYSLMHRFWHIAICAQKGVKVTKMLRGSDAPGGMKDQPVKAPRGSFKRVRKIARYISKYLTKDLISEFNKKRYWPSKGIDLEAAQVYWLDSLSQFDAIREACIMLGQWDAEMGMTSQNLFMPSERVVWCAVDPALSPPPPF